MSGSRPATGAVGSSKPTSAQRTKPRNKKGTVDLKTKEEEYRRLNEELESKAASLLKEADDILEGTSCLSDELPQEMSSLELRTTAGAVARPRGRPQSVPQKVTRLKNAKIAKRPVTGSKLSSKWCPPPQPAHQPVPRPVSSAMSLCSDSSDVFGRTRSPGVGQSDIGAVPMISSLVAGDTGSSSDGGTNEAVQGPFDDDVLPESAMEMGQEATIRFLKAKLRVMQEEMDRLCDELTTKNKRMAGSDAKCKELTDEVNKLRKTQQGNQVQMEKYKNIAEELKSKTDGLEVQVLSLKKELDSMRRSHSKATAEHGAVEVRLNRALEEAAKCRATLQQTKSDMVDSKQQDKLRIEELAGNNKRLERQKVELMTAFKKQMKLIDVLKRQKMHLEAAKLLSFTEEEFLKALDWAPT